MAVMAVVASLFYIFGIEEPKHLEEQQLGAYLLSQYLIYS